MNPVDTLKAELTLLADSAEMTEDADRVPGDDPTAQCVFIDMRPAKFDSLIRRAIAALSGGEAAGWMHKDDPSRVISAKQKAVALRDGGASASSVAPYTIPLYTTPRIPDGKEPVAWRVPTPYGVGYNFASEEVMRDMADWIAHGFEHGPLDTTGQVPEGTVTLNDARMLHEIVLALDPMLRNNAYVGRPLSALATRIEAALATPPAAPREE